MSLKSPENLSSSAPLESTQPPYVKRSGGPKKWLPWVIVGGIVLAGTAWRSRQNSAPNAPGQGGAAGGPGARDRAPIVNVVPVTTGDLTQTLSLIGSLRANQTVDLNSKIQGRVARVTVREGSRVTRGQLLVVLDDADLRAAVNAAQAQVATAQSRLQQSIVQLPSRVQQVRTGEQQAQAALQTARAQYQQALLQEPVARSTAENQVRNAREAVRTAQTQVTQSRDVARQTDLSTQAAIRTAEAQVGAAQATRDRAQAALAEVQRGARDQQIAQAQATVGVAEANLRDAQTELNRQKQLFQGGATARANVDSAQTRYDITVAQLESARQNLSLVREGATTEQVRQAQEAVQQGEEGIRVAQAGVGQARAGRIAFLTAQGDITNALAALSQTQAQYQTALSNLAQIPITQQETRTAQQAIRQAEATLAQARSNNTQIPVARSDIAIARAGVQSAQAALRQAQVNLAYARIYSPVNGVVNQKLTDEGETAGSGTALLNLVSLDRVYFEAQVPENSVTRVRVGQPVNMNVPAVSPQIIRGFVSDIVPVADARLRQFRVRVTIPNAPGQLTPGSFARGTVITQQITDALVVPIEAIVRAENQSAVYLALDVKGKKQVQRRVISTGLESQGRVQVLGGVRKGDPVILDPASVSDGDTVRVAKGAASDTRVVSPAVASGAEGAKGSGATGSGSGAASGAGSR